MKKTEQVESASAHDGIGSQLFTGWRFKTMIITVLCSIIGYFLFTLWAGWEQVLAAVVKVGPLGISLALLLSLTNYSLRFLRWKLFLQQLGVSVPWKPGIQIYLSGFALTITPGKSGESIRGVFLKDYAVPFRKSFGIFFAERISDLFSVGILACCGLWIYPEARPILAILALMMLLLFFVIQQDHWLQTIGRWIKKPLPHRLAPLVDCFIEVAVAFRSCFRSSSSALISAIILGLLAWGAEAVALYTILQILGHGVSLISALFTYGLSLVMGGITLLPGGLGGAEITMLELLKAQQIGVSDAVAVTLMIRLTSLWFSVFLGLLAFPKKRIKVFG